MSTYTSNNVNYSYVVGSGVATVAPFTSDSPPSGAITILPSFVEGVTGEEVTYNVTSI